MITESQDQRSMERFVLTGHSIFIPRLEETVWVIEDLIEVVQDEEEKEEEEDPPTSREEEEEDGSPREEGEEEAMAEV